MKRRGGEQVASGTKPDTPFVELCKALLRTSISTNSLSCSRTETETPPPNPFLSGLLTPKWHTNTGALARQAAAWKTAGESETRHADGPPGWAVD